MKAGGRLLYYDMLRIFANFSMICLHVAADNNRKVPIGSYQYNILNMYSGFVRFCVPVLLMLSGAFLLNPKKDVSIKSIYIKYALRILIAYIFWLLVYGIIEYIRLDEPDTNFIKMKILSGHYHLEFIPYLLGLYIATPYLREIVKNKNVLLYTLWICIIFSMLIPTIENFVTQSGMQKLLGKMFLRFPTQYVTYYLAGYYFDSIEFSKKKIHLFYILGIIGYLTTIFITAHISIIRETYFNMYGYYTINVMCVTFALFLFFKNVLSGWSGLYKYSKQILCLSQCSFGMYLIHDVFIQLTRAVGINSLIINPLFSVPLIGLVIFLCSFISVYLLRKLPFKFKRYIL